MLEKAAETTPATIGEYYFLFLVSFSILITSVSLSHLFIFPHLFFFFLPFLSVLFLLISFFYSPLLQGIGSLMHLLCTAVIITGMRGKNFQNVKESKV